ncbi:hypothetical protein G3545_04405 [Starkeya sp. ORNL1]|uniref:hypothetical protein n=1 Tax=Starkeya sp. ORNL1 TaxID=2709380 RepID=UPI00146303D2|nr:hypothetical protein [Starkeya sp. ORNL1]QJP12965.1 hypothetical protein G3545_04405 [Starkeya sp. ORNL1]
MSMDRIFMTTGAIQRFLGERGVCISADTLRRRAKDQQAPFPGFRRSSSPTAPLCARVAAVEAWLAAREAIGVEVVN